MSPTSYPAYKDSGVGWLGQIPEGWKLLPFWALFVRGKRLGSGAEELLSVYRDYGVIPKSSRDDNFNRASEDLTKYQVVEVGDLVINKMKAWQGSVAISQHSGIVSPAYFVFSPQTSMNLRYMHYLMRSKSYFQFYASISKGVRPNQWDLDPDQHKMLPVIFPSTEEQQAVADYLDQETGEIDAFIADQEQLIAVLNERRAATITQAVTKGLDPDVPMKDSGVEWLGEVPTAWDVGALKRFASVLDCKHVTAEFSDAGEYPLASIQQVQSKYVDLSAAKRTSGTYYRLLIGGDRKPRPSDLIFSRNATVGQVAQVGDEQPEFALGQDVCLVRERGKTVVTEYLHYVLRSSATQNQLESLMIGSTFRRINVRQIETLLLAIPDRDTQRRIIDYLDGELAEIDGAIKDAKHAIELSKERRSALISAAVTGKIDVRNTETTQQKAA